MGNFQAITRALTLAVLLSACNNSRFTTLTSGIGLTASTGSTTTASSTSSTGDTFKISSASAVAASGSTSQTVPNVTILFDLTQSTAVAGGQPALTNHCTATSSSTTSATTSKPCVCKFSWQEINQTGGSTIPITRAVSTPVSIVQAALATCPAPSEYGSIVDSTVINVTIAPTSTNTDAFTVTGYSFAKNSVVQSGSFQDIHGHVLDNVLHYSCYEQFQRGMSIISHTEDATNPQTGQIMHYPSASNFCVQKFGASGSTSGCNTLPPPDNTAQSYYYNLYIRAGEAGDINVGNARFVCPRVKESLGGSSSVGQQGNFWPKDTSFSLSLSPNPDFPVGVEANTKVADGTGDPSDTATSCYPSTAASGTPTGSVDPNVGIVHSCLGFAAKPAADGSCPYIKDSTGRTVFTYRLRRMIAVYPPIFDTDGTPIKGFGQASDTIYVLDRPVSFSGADPLKPYTMRGPKPCPFAYFDNKTVTGVLTDAAYPGSTPPLYVATNDPHWNNTNVDGIQLPNVDRHGDSTGDGGSCSAVLGLVGPNSQNMSLATLNASNPVFKVKYIRPMTAWAPHYEEDTRFKACAPQSFPGVVDPPLHFSKDPVTGNVNYCAEVYPSQNDNVPSLDRRPTGVSTGPLLGRVAPFTSHVAKNSASADCVASIPASIPTGSSYPKASASGAGTCVATSAFPQGWALHPSDMLADAWTDNTNGGAPAQQRCTNQTCDRTVITSGQSWARFPLVAPASAVETAIAQDSTYGCTITFDNGGAKTGKATPKQGCCGPNVRVWTSAAGSSDTRTKNTVGHLEPDAACLVPAY